jgi:hypothetical protein
MKSNPIFSTMGLKQGCVYILPNSVILMDFIMKITVQNRNRGIYWGLQDRLEVLDIADDICHLSSSFKDTESKINELVDIASEFNPKINVNKTKEISINTINMKKQIT